MSNVGDPVTPTHRTPLGGLDTWPTPHPEAARGPRLDEHLSVTVVDTAAYGWTRVRCENGWEAWVDGSQLEALAPSAPAASATGPQMAPSPTSGSSSHRLLFGLAGLVVVLAVVAVAAIMRRPGSESGTPTLIAPAGWSTSADGRTVALKKEDLDSATPTGPRARIAAKPSDDFQQLVDEATGQEIQAIDTPATTIVANRKGVEVKTIEGTPHIVRQYVTVRFGKGQAVQFVLEAPESEWDKDAPTLAKVPGFQ